VRKVQGLPVFEVAFPGELRQRLVAAILSGEKTAGATLREEYEPLGPDPLPEVGARSLLVDSDRRPVAVVEITEVRVVRAGRVDERFARDEGEGFESVADWRAAHERFWGSNPDRDAAGAPPYEIDDDTLVVCERFRVVERL
jgi:uncharacterized protein YhfF